MESYKLVLSDNKNLPGNPGFTVMRLDWLETEMKVLKEFVPDNQLRTYLNEEHDYHEWDVQLEFNRSTFLAELRKKMEGIAEEGYTPSVSFTVRKYTEEL